MSVVLVILVLALVVFVVATVVGGRSSSTKVGEWARVNAVALNGSTAPVVEVYLRNRTALRRVGAVGGLVIPPAFTAATGIDLRVAGFVWVLFGYLVGQIVAELTFARVPGSSARAASLGTRRLIDYLPRPLAVAQVALPVASGLLGIAVVVVATDGPGTGHGVTYVDAVAAALVAGPVAVVLAAATIAGERWLVRRPQPIVEPDLVELDDAMRSSSVRTVAATNVAIAALLIATQLGAIAYSLEPSIVQGALWATTAILLLFAYTAWQWWVNRGWRVRRPGPSISTGAPA